MMLRPLAVAACSLLLSSPAWALFHLAHISEVKTQVGGPGGDQYVEIEMEAGSQTFVTDSILSAWSCNGDFVGELLTVPSDIGNGGNGVRWIMSSVTPLGGITPDFDGATPGMAADCGQVCWGAPGASVPPPASWDHEDPSNYVDCVAYGPYTGVTHPGSGTPTPLPPGDETFALVRTGDSGDNAADFALGCPSPENNDGDVGDFGPCSAPTTTTTTVPGGTTTTTLPSGGGTTDLVPAKKLILKTKAEKPEKSALVFLAKKESSLTIGRGPGTSDDPTQTGGRLLVASGSAAGAFVERFQLASGRWTPKTKGGETVGYIFKGDGPVTLVKLIEGKILKVKAKGRDVPHDLDVDPNPVIVVLEIGEHALCFELGGTTKHKADKLYKASNAPAPSSSANCDEIR
jgi:hypothetical protein